MTSDEELMLEFQRGSRPALEELFARYRQPLYGFFRRRLEGKERAEDLAQETFLAVIRAAARYEPRALVRTYLYGIALKLLAAERRKQFRDASSDSFLEPVTSENPDAALWVRQALGKLDTPEREILMLRFVRPQHTLMGGSLFLPGSLSMETRRKSELGRTGVRERRAKRETGFLPNF